MLGSRAPEPARSSAATRRASASRTRTSSVNPHRATLRPLEPLFPGQKFFLLPETTTLRPLDGDIPLDAPFRGKHIRGAADIEEEGTSTEMSPSRSRSWSDEDRRPGDGAAPTLSSASPTSGHRRAPMAARLTPASPQPATRAPRRPPILPGGGLQVLTPAPSPPPRRAAPATAFRSAATDGPPPQHFPPSSEITLL
jgi:hypothetical protein